MMFQPQAASTPLKGPWISSSQTCTARQPLRGTGRLSRSSGRAAADDDAAVHAFKIRWGTPADVPSLETVDALCSADGSSGWSAESYRSMMTSSSARILVCEKNGGAEVEGEQALAGFAAGLLVAGELQIENIGVHPQWRGRGVGGHLMSAIMILCGVLPGPLPTDARLAPTEMFSLGLAPKVDLNDVQLAPTDMLTPGLAPEGDPEDVKLAPIGNPVPRLAPKGDPEGLRLSPTRQSEETYTGCVGYACHSPSNFLSIEVGNGSVARWNFSTVREQKQAQQQHQAQQKQAQQQEQAQQQQQEPKQGPSSSPSALAQGIEHLDAPNECMLEVREDNLAAIRMYTKLGFVKTGVRKKYYADGCSCVYMACPSS